MKSNNSEHLFAQICEYTFLRGFTFHSPKIYDPTEKEVGDIVIWVRTQLIVFELISRHGDGDSTRSFVKRIGEKREQLVKDYEAFKNHHEVTMVNRSDRKIEYKKDYFVPSNFFGVVIIDCDTKLDKIHYGTLLKTLEGSFPIAVMLKSDFKDILDEVDTSSDLKFYLQDRFAFFTEVYKQNAAFFLDLNHSHEKQLVGFYKLNNYKFPVEMWDPKYDYWGEFNKYYSNQIEKRNQENRESKVIDGLVNMMMEIDEEELPLVHAWQLAVTTRRMRASMFKSKIINALERMHNGNPERYFAIHNGMTDCWLVFYFQFGGSREYLFDKIHKLTKLKLIYEITERDFSNSVIGYGFRKSQIITENTVDDTVLAIEDAVDFKEIPPDLVDESKKFFRGSTSSQVVRELPD